MPLSPLPYRQLCRDAWLAGLTHDELRATYPAGFSLYLFIQGEAEFARLAKQKNEATSQLVRLDRLHGEGPGRSPLSRKGEKK